MKVNILLIMKNYLKLKNIKVFQKFNNRQKIEIEIIDKLFFLSNFLSNLKIFINIIKFNCRIFLFKIFFIIKIIVFVFINYLLFKNNYIFLYLKILNLILIK